MNTFVQKCEMNWSDYIEYFNEVLEGKITTTPYDDAHFMEYTKLNISRMNRWLKQGVLNEGLVIKLKEISAPQNWVLITEPWCGDAAHIVPFIYLLSNVNPLISLEIQLRDIDSEIENYLTNGSKSVPKLIVRNDQNEDLYTWGPRPVAGQNHFMHLKEQGLPLDQQKMGLQQWYNLDRGESLQQELLDLNIN
jgi:hypothetical protein